MVLDEKKVNALHRSLKRIFAVPVTRCTFRELQNAITASVEGNRDVANAIVECLLKGEPKDGIVEPAQNGALHKIIDEFSVSAGVAKDVHEKGEFINLITSDIISQANQIAFDNTIKLVNGDVFRFITEPESTLQLLQHFLNRVAELEKNENAKRFLTTNKSHLQALKAKLDHLLSL